MSDSNDLEKRVALLGEARVHVLDNMTCRITIVNACPPDWNVHIVAAGAVFSYRDGTNFQDGPVAMDITSGNAGYLSSNDSTKCVRKFLLTMSVVIPGNPAQAFQNTSPDIPNDQCLLGDTITLKPQRDTVSVGELGHKRERRVELVRSDSRYKA